MMAGCVARGWVARLNAASEDSAGRRRKPHSASHAAAVAGAPGWLRPVPKPCSRLLDLTADRAAAAALLVETWATEDPYRSLERPEHLLGAQVDQGLDTALFGIVALAASGDALCAVALVHRQAPGPPTLTWLTVAREARERGLATALLALVTRELRARGVDALASAASAANLPSLRWHLSRGFEFAPDPVREILRAAPAARPARDRTHGA